MSAELYGLILAGGESRRMGDDKFSLKYGGVSQGIRLGGLLGSFCGEVFVSCRPGQRLADLPAGVKILPDRFAGIGPLGGLLTAMDRFPGMAWLVVACDMPLLNPGTIARLIAARRQGAPATAFVSRDDGMPEPLCAIYEPASHVLILDRLARGDASLRRILFHMDSGLIEPVEDNSLTNVNTRSDYEHVRNSIPRSTNN